MKTATGILTLFLTFTFFCCTSQKTEWQGTIEEVDGVTVVKNPKEPKYGIIDLALEKDLIIGNEIYENFQFQSFVRVAIDNENNIYALDYGNHRVQKFDEDGKFLLSFGKEGQGPGDLNRPSKYFLNERGESTILDSQLIIKIFSSEGLIQNTIKLKNRISDFFINSIGNIFTHYSFRDEENNVKRTVIKLDTAGNIIERYIEFTELKTSHSIKDGEMTFTFGMHNPFAPVFCFSPYGSDGFCYGFSSKYEVYVRDSSGKLLYIIQKEGDALPIHNHEKEDLIKGAEQRNPKIPKNLLRNAINFPPHKPFFNKILTDNMSRIYIRKFGAITESDDIKFYEFDLFSPNGYFLYKIRMPFVPQVIKNGFLYQVDSNLDTGEIKIIRFRINNWNQIKTGIN